MFCLSLVATILIVELLSRIEFHVPGFGDVHIPGIDRIARAVENAWRRWLQPHIDTLVGWTDNVAAHLREFPREVASTVTDLAQRLDHYAHVVVHDVIKAFLRPVRDVANAAHALAVAATAGLVDLRHDAGVWINDAVRWTQGELADLRSTAHGWVVDLRREAFAAIDAVHRQVVADVLPRIGAIEDVIPGLRGGIDDLRRLYDRLADWALPIAAVFSGAAALALLRHVNDCRARSDRLCQTDPDFLDELLGLLFLGVSITELQGFVRTAAPVAGGLAEEFLDRT